MRPLFERVFGLAWTGRLGGWPLLLTAAAALAAAGVSAALSVGIWPAADAKLDPPGSPGVVRNGARLEFSGKTPWVGHQREGGRRISFGGAPPEETPAPETWFHYGPDAVISCSPAKTTTNSPFDLEWTLRGQIFLLSFAQNLLMSAVFFFSLTMLLRAKRVELPAYGPLRILARCLIPACVYAAIASPCERVFLPYASLVAFLLVLGMNVLLFVLAARPTPEPEPFEV